MKANGIYLTVSDRTDIAGQRKDTYKKPEKIHGYSNQMILSIGERPKKTVQKRIDTQLPESNRAGLCTIQ